MFTHKSTVLFIAMLMVAVGTIGAETLSLTDSAFVRSGSHADTAQAWSATLALKNAGGDNGRIAMLKADLSSITGQVESAVFNVYSKDPSAHNIYIYGVKESATFEDWTGGSAGNATWNSVTTGGLFSPQQDLHLASDPNLVLLTTQAMSGSASDVLINASGQELINLINNDTDDLLTFVFSIDANINSAVRPHNHASAPSLNFTYAGASTEFQYPLYGDAAQLYSNSAPYDLTQETYTFSTLWSTPAQEEINFLPQSYNSPIVTRGNDTFVLYIDTDHRLKIAHLTNGVFKTETFVDNTLYQSDEFYAGNGGNPGFHTFLFEDSHHSASLGIDENGFLHIVGDMHNYPRYPNPMLHLPLRYFDKDILYWRSDNPLDISSFSFKGDQAGQCPPGYGFTYQVFYNDLNGKLQFTARGHQSENNSIRSAPFSSYDADTGTWSIIGGLDPDDPESAPRTFYDDGYEYTVDGGVTNTAGKYSKTHPHGVFDRNNKMHLVTPLLSNPTEHPGTPNFYHFVDTIMYAQSDNGTDFTKADGTFMTLPATIDLTANQADIAYSTSGYLAVLGNIAVDYQNNPYTVAKHKYTNGDPNDNFIIGWDGTTWTNYGEIVDNTGDFRLVHDPAGVMSYIIDSNSKFYRFWHPTDTPLEVDTPWDIKVIDYEYLKKTGNIMGLSKVNGELTVVKVEIENRPGMELIDPPTETPDNNAPVITSPATATGLDLSVAATDPDGDLLTFTWSKSYGPGDAFFSSNDTADSSNTTVSVTTEGTYEFKVVVSDGTDQRTSTCYTLASSTVGTPASFQIGGLVEERDTDWNNLDVGTSTGTYSFADSTDPNLVFTIQAVAQNGDLLTLNSTHLAVDSSARQTDPKTGRLNLDESILLTISFKDPSNSLASLEIDSFGPYWGNGSTETTVFTDASGNSTNVAAFDHNLPNNLIDYTGTGLDELTKYNTASWSMTVSTDDTAGLTQSALGAFKLAYIVDLSNNPPPYTQWAAKQGLTEGINDDHGDDPENDGMNNLLEYALGGNPLVDDAAVKLPNYGTGPNSGTNWLNYVYRRRLDAAARGLTYEIVSTDDLASNIWTNGTEEAGSTLIDTEFESVTNRIPTDIESQQFIKLEVDISE